MGCDYLGGVMRTDGAVSHNDNMACKYLERALELAKANGDSEFMDMIEADLDNVKKRLVNGK